MHRFLYMSLLLPVCWAGGCHTAPPEDGASPRARLAEEFPGIRCFAPAEPARGEVAVVVHGLFRGSRTMATIGRDLAGAGYDVFVYDYESTRDDVAGHGGEFRRFLCRVAGEYPGAKIHIVTHSMGALLARYALAHLDPDAPDEWRDKAAEECLGAGRFGRIVMIAPPNRGSKIARAVSRIPWGERLVRPIGDLSSEEGALASRLPCIEVIPTGIIVARYDVAVAEGLTDYPPAEEVITIGVTHSLSVLSRRVRNAVLGFLAEGKFPR